jgi:hypothetical protein
VSEAFYDGAYYLSHRLLVGDIARDRQRLSADPFKFTQSSFGWEEVVGGYCIATFG